MISGLQPSPPQKSFLKQYCKIRMGSVVSNPDRLPVESLLLDVADVLATTLDLETTLRRVAELVRKVIDYEIFAILLLNEKTPGTLYPVSGGIPAGSG